MKVLFVCSGNKGISPIIKAQAVSLEKIGLKVQYAPIVGKGFMGYLRSIPFLRKEIKKMAPDIIHAHYSFCGIIASLATRKPVVCSLMGSDVKSAGLWRVIIRFFVWQIWTATIVKSQYMKQSLGLESVAVIPNGVDLELFKPMDKDSCREKLGWPKGKQYLLFAADPERKEKNFALAQQAVILLGESDVELKVVHGVPHSELPVFMNASDLLLLTSLWEGSPNVVKEAMACNLPVVATEVGDVKYLFDKTQGYIYVESDPVGIADKIRYLFASSHDADGRNRIIEISLDSFSVAHLVRKKYDLVKMRNKAR